MNKTKNLSSLTKQLITIIIIVALINLNISFASALQISNAQVRDVTSTSAIIEWMTDTPANSTIQYGRGVLNETVYDSELNTSHSIKLDNLAQSLTPVSRLSSTK